MNCANLVTGRIISFLIAATLAGEALAQDEIRVELEGVYQSWARAMRDKNYELWAESTATFRQAEVRNAIVSAGEIFPDALFAIPLSPPDIRDLKFLESRTVGLTANLIYFGKVDLGFSDGKVPDNVLVLSFVLERRTGWRFDTSRLVNLAGIPEVRADLIAGRMDFLKSPEFEPRGRVPAVPPPSPKPEYYGRIDIAAHGYAVSMKLNGFSYPEMANTGRRHLVIGGFKEGENRLELSIRQIEIPDGEERILELGAYASRRPQSDDVSEIFTWLPGDKVPDTYSNPIWVTEDKVPR